MAPLEPNPSSIRHGVVFAEFREFGLSSVECQDSRWQTKNSKSALRFHILWNLNEHICKLNRNLSCEICYCIFTKICKNRSSFCYRLNAIKCTLYLRKVTGSVTYTVKTGTL